MIYMVVMENVPAEGENSASAFSLPHTCYYSLLMGTYLSMKKRLLLPAIATLFWTVPATADSTEARCDIYPAGSDHASKMIACTFGQRQGYITISRDDGVMHNLSPDGNTTGNFRDQDGSTVYRESGMGAQGLSFRFPDESVYVYWNTAALHPSQGADNPTAPFTTADYDATTLLRCLAPGATQYGTCPAGILRMEDGEASIVVQNQAGERFTINFMKDYVNATNREVEAQLTEGTWVVSVSNGEVYEVPLAAIEGG